MTVGPATGSQWPLALTRYLKFNAVGLSGVPVQLGMLAFLMQVMRIGYLTAGALSIEAAIVHNFFWHQRFTWKDAPSRGSMETMARFVRFNLASATVSVGNLLLVLLLVGELHLHPVCASFLAIIACSVINFSVNAWLVFPRRINQGQAVLGEAACFE